MYAKIEEFNWFRSRRGLDLLLLNKYVHEPSPGFDADRSCYERISQYLNALDRSITSWKKALDVLPKENLTTSELKQKGQYDAQLKIVEAELAQKMSADFTGFHLEKDQAPWVRAERMMPELVAGGTTTLGSSVSDFVTQHKYISQCEKCRLG